MEGFDDCSKGIYYYVSLTPLVTNGPKLLFFEKAGSLFPYNKNLYVLAYLNSFQLCLCSNEVKKASSPPSAVQ